jgi:hypothetical protein
MLSLSLVFLESAEGSPLPSSPVVPPGVAAFRDLPCVLRRTLCRRRWTGLGCKASTPADANITGTVLL